MKKIIVAIDGFSSSGKSSMAKRLAKEIGYRYIDSGAMYRAVTLYAMREGMILNDGTVNKESLIPRLNSLTIDFAVDQSTAEQNTTLNGENIEKEIRDMPVSNNVSAVAAIPEVRHALVDKQKAFGETRGIVMDGRDIGTTVFPDAELKIFVTASAQTRAQRRLLELTQKGVATSFEEVLANVVHRDHVDTTREESPLRQAKDAVVLDNSSMSLDDQHNWLLNQFNKIVYGES
ncbi:MAG: (d)CMP kinase [Paramuribaculum sp.]|nr:(d)CMP kinase [Paramuribaculum sp.]